MAGHSLVPEVPGESVGEHPRDYRPCGEGPLTPDGNVLMEAAGGRIVLFDTGGPMSFGAADGTAWRMAEFDQYDAFVLDRSDVPRIDFATARAIDDMIRDAQSGGHHVFVVGA